MNRRDFIRAALGAAATAAVPGSMTVLARPNPIDEFRKAKQAIHAMTGTRPNVLILGQQAARIWRPALARAGYRVRRNDPTTYYIQL